MTAQEMQKRQARAENLKVLKSEDGRYFVESSNGKILYHVSRHNDNFTCTCGDYTLNIKTDAEFKCKHILAVLNSEDIEPVIYLEKHQPQLDERFLVQIKGKDFVLYAGVLDLATQKGLVKLEVDLIQSPTRENGNEAVCKATAVSKTGSVYTDFGDANPGNCVDLVSKHIIRVASTRAKGRALRDMCNIGIACLEELGNFDEVNSENQPNRGERPPYKKAANKKPSAKIPDASHDRPAGNQAKISEAQKRAIYNLGARNKLTKEEIEKQIVDKFGASIDDLSMGKAGVFIQQLQTA